MVSERADVIPALVEVFREHGYEGTSLSLIGERTGLGRGSLYHFFPGGKDEMARVVLEDIDGWFERAVFAPLRETGDPRAGIGIMFDRVLDYFHSGRRACLVAVFALPSSRDRFAGEIRRYFAVWVDSLADALMRAGRGREAAAMLAEEVVAGLQGALVLARAHDDADIFVRGVERLRARLAREAT